MPGDTHTKLPIPFFKVLEEEYALLNEPISLTNCWDFDITQIQPASESIPDPEQSIRDVVAPFVREQNQASPISSSDELIQAINGLLHGKRLSDYKAFPKCRVTAGLKALLQVPLPRPGEEDGDFVHLNRLLLEFLCPDQIKRIYEVNTAKLYAKIHRTRGRAALCLSGGGIRSATFALGVLQGLSRNELLTHFDYLSTVSGGGYIGSWLSSWIHHAKDPAAVFKQLAYRNPESPLQPEPPQIRHLRAYSNYLTPRLGLLSADTWVLVGTYLRNLFLNWLVFIPLLLGAIAIPRLCVAVLVSPAPTWLMNATLAGGILSLIVAFAYSTMSRPGVEEHLKRSSKFWFARRSQGQFLIWCLLPLWFGVACLTMFWGWLQNCAGDYNNSFISGIPGKGAPRVLDYVFFGVGLHFLGWFLGEFILRFRLKSCSRENRRRQISKLLKEFCAVVLTGALGGLCLWVVANQAYQNYLLVPNTELYVCFAAPVILLIFLATASVFIGLSSGYTSDEDREWWARMGAWILIAIGGWLVFSCPALFGPLALYEFPKIIAGLGGLSGIFTLAIGHSDLTAANKKQETDAGLAGLLLNKALAVAAPLSHLCIVALLSLTTSWAFLELSRFGSLGTIIPGLAKISSFTGTGRDFLQIVHHSPWRLVSLFICVSAGLGYVFSMLINLNKFSLHSVYRNRLIRAYLGASNPKRRPNPFTGFDPSDNLCMADLAGCGNEAKIQRPLHVVNMALNLVSGENLAWQQRKAETFTASGLHCGSFRLGYRRSAHYATKPSGTGLTLGTAVTISGAAASPNMGYHSSSLVAALMTLFNVRLGWWLGNPGPAGQRTFADSAPKPAAWHIVKEALGLTDSNNSYVYLSDGGHFENLGLYEMILRRCKVIVVSDAGCDPKCSLEDLGNAIRKIRIDLGIKITIQKSFGIYSRDDEAGKKGGKYCAIGEIDYGGVDQDTNGRNCKGTLIYLKPAICGDEPKDVFNYMAVNKNFPHEPTSDQWFSESQFESYRMLGLHIANFIYNQKYKFPLKPASNGESALTDFIAVTYRYVELEVPPELRARFATSAPHEGFAD
jgi:hypothetical protein